MMLLRGTTQGFQVLLASLVISLARQWHCALAPASGRHRTSPHPTKASVR
jgi:hypothetical protein